MCDDLTKYLSFTQKMDVKLELAVIGNNEKFVDELLPAADGNNEVLELAKSLLKGEYEDVLKKPVSAQVLGIGCGYNDQNSDPERDLADFIKTNTQNVLSSLPEEERQQGCIKLLWLGVSCLQLYIQNNWVGPPTQTSPYSFLPSCYTPDTPDNEKNLLESMEVDGSPVYSLSRHLVYFQLAKTILLDCLPLLTVCVTSEWWAIRCLAVHQALLEDRAPSIKKHITKLIDCVSAKEPIASCETYSKIMSVFHVEASLLMSYYYEPLSAKEHVRMAKKFSHLGTHLTGMLGKRTRFQVTEVAQLLLRVEREHEDCDAELAHALAKLSPHDELPQDCALSDDTVLNSIQLQQPEDATNPDLSQEEQAVVLAALLEHRRNFEGSGDIIQEESLAFISAVLAQPKNWCVASSALLQRSYWESNSTRRMERTLAQLESLVQQFEKPTTNAGNRLYLVNAVKVPPIWEVERELGHLLRKIGAVKAALDMYLRLHMWEDVIQCYQALGRQEKAEKTIRQQLAVQETPSLYCYLGDVLQDLQYYEKAWQLSSGRYARAQRAMAYYHLYRGNFADSLPCFEKSLALNSLQIGVWFSYGCAAMACKKFEESAQAFRRCVNINSDNFEAWNNLASVYIKSNQKPRAFATLQEAIKCDYENWRIWENYLLTSADVGQFEETMKASHRLLDLKDKWGDGEVLAVLVTAVNSNLTDANGQPSDRLRSKLQELFGRVTTKVVNDADIWRLYGELLLGNRKVSQTDRQRAAQFLQKSHRCLTQIAGWEKDVEKCRNIVDGSIKLAKVYMACVAEVEDTAIVTQLLSSARLMLNGVLAKIKKGHTNPVTNEVDPSLTVQLQQLQTEINTIQELIAKYRGS